MLFGVCVPSNGLAKGSLDWERRSQHGMGRGEGEKGERRERRRRRRHQSIFPLLPLLLQHTHASPFIPPPSPLSLSGMDGW